MSLFDILGGIGSIGAGYVFADDRVQTGKDAAAQMGELAGQLQSDSAFKGYGVTTGLGSTTVNPDGSTSTTVGPDAGLMGYSGNMSGLSQQAMQQAMQQAGATNAWAGQAQNMMGQGYDQMANAFANIPGREQEIYNRAMAMQQPGLDAQRASQQAREYAMGRGGVRGSQFGGTAEDAATARAQAQAQNQASFQAMNQAQQEAMNSLSAGSQMFGAGNTYNQAGIGNAQLGQNSAAMLSQIGNAAGGLGMNAYASAWEPMNQQFNWSQIGGQNADRAQTGQLTGINHAAQLGLGGIQAQINAETAASNLYSNMFQSGLGALSSGANSIAGSMGDGSSFWESLWGLTQD